MTLYFLANIQYTGTFWCLYKEKACFKDIFWINAFHKFNDDNYLNVNHIITFYSNKSKDSFLPFSDIDSAWVLISTFLK
ncbi:MAG TPA: hypothetical protein VN726_04200 [Hanamia sp.]|nr:hypothetical protein [Hanamia sp.]